jgi:hypothetical protein
MTHPTNVLTNPTKFFRANFSIEFTVRRTVDRLERALYYSTY